MVGFCLGLGTCMALACSSKDLSEFNAGGGGAAGNAGQAGGSAGSAGTGIGGAAAGGASGGAIGSGGAAAGGASGGSSGSAGAGTGGTGTGGHGTGSVGGAAGAGTGGSATGGTGTGGTGTGGTGICTPVTTNSGWEKAKTVTTASLGTGGWVEPSAASSSDNKYATFNFKQMGVAPVLQAGNFGFLVPTNATILGVEVSVERGASMWDSARDETITLAKAEQKVGTNLGFAEWELNDKATVYGSATQTWSVPNLSHAFVNAADFEVWVRPECFSASRCAAGIIVRVDEVRARIHYKTSCGN